MRRWLALVFLAVGCSSSSLPPGDAPGSLRLVSSDYTLAAGQEIYICKRVTMKEDVWIHAITPVDGVGTHHELLAIDPNPQLGDGIESPCDPLQPTWNMLFASGVNSPSLTMPDGVAFHVNKGDQMVFQMHLLNATPDTITSKASLDVIAVDAAQVQNEAEMVLAGPPPIATLTRFQIPPGDNQVISSSCTMTGASNFYALFPHMHKLGRHIKVSTIIGGATNVIWDNDYKFTEQGFTSFDPIPMQMGDKIHVDCTYDNDTGAVVPMGESSNQEMCFAISYRFPKLPPSQFGALCPK
ncbi:MAG: monooxygenase [Ilumatobacteraceae bacterium]